MLFSGVGVGGPILVGNIVLVVLSIGLSRVALVASFRGLVGW